MRLRVGDRVQVRNEDDKPWRKGILEEVRNGSPIVRLDGHERAGRYVKVRPMVTTHALAKACGRTPLV